jgi:hypothetical protein
MTPPQFSCSPAAGDAGAPARLRLAAGVPIRVQAATGTARIRLLGTPGPDGVTGPQGEKGDQGAPGITILPTDTPINGGFF